MALTDFLGGYYGSEIYSPKTDTYYWWNGSSWVFGRLPADLRENKTSMLFVSPPPSVNSLFVWASAQKRVPTREYVAWKKAAALELMAQRARPFCGSISINILVPNNPRRDLDNHAKPILDLLVKSEIIDGDSWKTVKSITLRWWNDTRVGIRVAPYCTALDEKSPSVFLTQAEKAA